MKTVIIIGIISAVCLLALAGERASADAGVLHLAEWSIHDFTGGLWNGHTSGRADSSSIALKKKKMMKNKKQLEDDLPQEVEEEQAAATNNKPWWRPSTWAPTVFKSDGAGLGANFVNAFSPEYSVICQIDGKPGFLRAATLYGMPADVAVDIGTGHSNALDCEINANKGEGQELGLLAPGEHRLNSRMVIVPLSRHKASVFQVQRIGSMPRQLKDYVAEAFGSGGKKKAMMSEKEKFEQAAAVGSPSDAADAAAAVLPEDMKVGGLHPDSFVATHRAFVEVEYQNLDPLSGLSPTVLEQHARKENNKRHHTLAQFSANFEPINKQVGAALAEFEKDTTSGCLVQVTRVVGHVTTMADAILHLAVRYSGNCPSPLQAPSSSAAVAAVEDEMTSEDGSSSSSSSASSINTTNIPQETFVTVTVKRFADIGDDEVDQAYDTPWYHKKRWGPTIGAIVLLTVIVGGRRGLGWMLKKKGIDVDKFLKNTRARSKEDILKMRKERLASKGGPMTDEEVSRLQEEEDRVMVESFKKQEAEYQAAKK